jgi:hypothetical protein
MNSFIAHQDYLKGKTSAITLESLHSSLWTIDDIRNRFNMNGAEKPIAEKCLQVIAEKQIADKIRLDKENLEKEIIIETVNKEDGESIHCVSNIHKQSLQGLRNDI